MRENPKLTQVDLEAVTTYTSALVSTAVEQTLYDVFILYFIRALKKYYCAQLETIKQMQLRYLTDFTLSIVESEKMFGYLVTPYYYGGARVGKPQTAKTQSYICFFNRPTTYIALQRRYIYIVMFFFVKKLVPYILQFY